MTTWMTISGRAICAATFSMLLPATLVAQRQNGLLVGRVLSGDVAVPSALIMVSGGRATLARVDGRFRMSLPAGRYQVRAQRLGYGSGSDSVTVLAGQSSAVNFRIERSIAMLDAVTAVGTRYDARTVIDAPVPIDVLYGADLRATGRTETARMIQSLSPSANTSRAGVGEASDVMRPLTLRGLNPDQVLVLVNGKRRHSSALLNVNNSVGRGSTGVDLNSIPASMIERIEILRDGASAQYGSDAVAGVVNVVLKSGVHGDATTTMGGNVTTLNRGDAAAAYPSGQRSARDGRTLQASIDKGVVFGERGFLHGDLEVRDHGSTNRALGETRSAFIVPSPDGVSNRFGDAQTHDLALFLNGGNLFAGGLEVYGNAGGSRRTLAAASVLTTATTPARSQLPVTRPTIDDYAGTLGLKWRAGEWLWDVSGNYGTNRVDYRAENGITSSSTTPASYDAGRVRYGQSTVNLDLSRNLPYFDGSRLAVGAELRHENYAIDRGEVLMLDGFSGIGAAQETDRSRHDLAGYVDVETDLTPSLMLGVAGRVEDYSDVGTLGDGKLSLRWEPVRRYALRTSAGRGYRAPSLAQSYYSNVFTGAGTQDGSARVLRVDDASVGASPLRAERATNYSVGVAAEPLRSFTVSADLYRVDVKDRVALLEAAVATGTLVSEYSANAADTRTTGLDVNAGYGMPVMGTGMLRLTGGLNVNRTVVTSNLATGAVGLGRVGIVRLERGQPSSNLIAGATYKLSQFGAMVRTQRFGEVTTASDVTGSTPDQTFGAKWVTDANFSFKPLRRYTVTVGADNLFDVYPDRNNVPGSATARGNGFFGIFPYNASSPFGFNGRFVYGRLSLYL